MIGLRAEERDPRETEEHGGYTLGQVLQAERWAWAGHVVGKHAEFFYDGIEFWRQDRSGSVRAVSRLETPPDGWWHKPDCNCGPCKARTMSPSAQPEAAARS